MTSSDYRRLCWLRLVPSNQRAFDVSEAIRPYLELCRLHGMKVEESISLAFASFGPAIRAAMESGNVKELRALACMSIARRKGNGYYAANRLLESEIA